ncbi:HNH endonuclease [Bradyrhizobium sp. HKCCYLRH1030]|uniref:HNH endonuclease n=1 Tax=Bradyrhizobium sp. HKCCYLRH1030 TaxID=3420744 RepID=UPI003EB74E9A
MKAVFDTKPTSIYNDDISRHYQFPRRYLGIIERCVGDWIVLRRPRADGGNLAYFAVARVVSVERDERNPGLSYANLGEYLPFDRPVPWTVNGRYSEQALRDIPQTQVGVFLRGRSVRHLGEDDFADLVAMGLYETLNADNAQRLGVPATVVEDAAAAFRQLPPAGERERRIESILSNRIIRDANFRNAVYNAYDNRCAATGLQMFDGRGNSEVHAAHIWAVADGGPDVVQNGIALTATVHWLFDRFLISITDDYRIIAARTGIPDELLSLLNRHDGSILLPRTKEQWPHPAYLKRHRDKFASINMAHPLRAR